MRLFLGICCFLEFLAPCYAGVKTDYSLLSPRERQKKQIELGVKVYHELERLDKIDRYNEIQYKFMKCMVLYEEDRKEECCIVLRNLLEEIESQY